jgi:hypothetical protein
MFSRRSTRKKFVKDLTRTRHMTAVSAVVLATTFMPLLGLPDIYELRAFQGAVEGFSDARASVLAPRRDDEAARDRSARSVIRARGAREHSSDAAGAEHVLTVERPEHRASQMIDTADILPLPPLEDSDLEAPIEDEDVVLPDIEEEPEAPAESEDEMMDDKEPAEDEEEL